MRNLYKPNRFNVASIQAQQTLGGDVMQMNEEGDYVEWRDYKRALDEIGMLTHTIKYWEIEAKTDNDRWLRALEDVDRLRERYAEAAQENARLKAEVDNSNLINTELLVLSNQQASEVRRLQAEVERLRKADGWQPMETAPCDPNIRIIICTFDDDVEITYSSDLCHYSEREYPKYWMPVPAAAKEGKPSV